MSYFLALVIIVLGCGGFYEYNILNSRHEGDVQRLTDETAQLDSLKEENTKLTTDNARLTKLANDDQAQITDLTKQAQDAQAALASGKQKDDAAKAPSIGAVTNPMPTPGTNNLGTIGTLDGKVYPNSQLMKVQADGIVISYSGGITQVAYSLMPSELQKRFGFNPKVAVVLTADEVAMQEQKRKSAGPTAGN